MGSWSFRLEPRRLTKAGRDVWVDVRVGAAAGNSRKASLRRCASVCDLNDMRQFCKNIGKSVPGRGNSQGKGPGAGAGLAGCKEQKEGTWFSGCRVGEAKAGRRAPRGWEELGFLWGRGSQARRFRCYCLPESVRERVGQGEESGWGAGPSCSAFPTPVLSLGAGGLGRDV